MAAMRFEQVQRFILAKKIFWGQVHFKDGAFYCYCAYLLRISRYSDFLRVVLINTGIFLRGQNYTEKAELSK